MDFDATREIMEKHMPRKLKLVFYLENLDAGEPGNHPKVFDRQQTVLEFTDEDAANAAKVPELKTEYERLRAKVPDKLPKPNEMTAQLNGDALAAATAFQAMLDARKGMNEICEAAGHVVDRFLRARIAEHFAKREPIS